MADNEKDVPIKEQNDGSVLAKLEDHIDHFPEEEKQEVTVDVEDSDQDDDEPVEAAEGGEVDSDPEETDEDREKIREARREKMLQAAQENDAAGQVEYLEQLTDAKQRLQQAQYYKKQQIEQAKAPKQNVPTPIAEEVQRNATQWLKKNSWYDPQARDTDSRIAKVIDQELAADGWDPSDSEYWEELDNRLSARLPHRYTSKGGQQTRRAGPTASSRVANTTSARPGTITLSPQRVQAIKDAGAWDDVEKRNKMIRAYASYDRANKG